MPIPTALCGQVMASVGQIGTLSLDINCQCEQLFRTQHREQACAGFCDTCIPQFKLSSYVSEPIR
jgi:hypothetical protein